MPETTDAFAGQGGSYLRDPQTGERTLIERTQPQSQPAAAETETNESEQSQ